MRHRIIALALMSSVAAGCAGRESASVDSGRARVATACNAPGVRDVVTRFGARLRDVSLLAPAPDVSRAMRDAYGPLVTPSLLDRWLAAPTSAPGRQVSSPWPDHIAIDSVVPADSGACEVEGRVVYRSSADSSAAQVTREQPVTLRVVDTGGWHIDDFHDAPNEGSDADAAADVVRRYYAALDAHDYRTAYTLWGDNGASSRQSFDEFRAGYSALAHDSVFVDRIGRVEGAAGSRYVEIAVRVHATTSDGTIQRFTGTYTLRRVVVDGATDSQRRWHLDSASLHTDEP